MATDESRMITGTEILIDGGLTIVEPVPMGPVWPYYDKKAPETIEKDEFADRVLPHNLHF